jgi:hypothetical protein
MRKVVIQGAPPEEWVKRAKALEKKLTEAATPGERSALIDKHQAHWRKDEIREWLLKQFNDKCWYSEARDTAAPIHVDHFRPKGRVTDKDGTHRDGYWWLAFEWSNYRICGHFLNVKKNDCFPLLEGDCAKPGNILSLQLEAPVLIDPLSDSTRLISFERDEIACKAVPAASIGASDLRRVTDTIEIIGLNTRPALGRKRADFWDSCRMRITEYVNADGPHVLRMFTQAAAKVRLKEMIDYNAEFSSVAEACIRKNAPEPLVALVFEQQRVPNLV